MIFAFFIVLVGFIFINECASASMADCSTDGSQSGCQTFEYSNANATADMASLCNAMFWMPGCTILKLCDQHADSHYCQPMSILADVCVKDPGMSRMKGCATYNNLCKSSTVVQQCSVRAPIPHLLSTSNVTSFVRQMCQSHAMAGCEKCPVGGRCDFLQVYADLCKSMPEMPECSMWQKMCSDDLSTWSELCPTSQSFFSDPPIMKMFFHTGYKDYVLFKEWVPTTLFSYILTFLAIIAISLLYEYVVTLRIICDTFWWRAPARLNAGRGLSGISGSYLPIETVQDELAGHDSARFEKPPPSLTRLLSFTSHASPRFRVDVELVRASFKMVELALSYALMLIAMTFNIGLFIAVVLGAGVGSLIFARFQPSAPQRLHCC